MAPGETAWPVRVAAAARDAGLPDPTNGHLPQVAPPRERRCATPDCLHVRAMHDDGGPRATPGCVCPQWQPVDLPAALADFGDNLTEEARGGWMATMRKARDAP